MTILPSISVGGAVAASGFALPNTSANIYTAPSNGYAILQLNIIGNVATTNIVRIVLASQAILQFAAGAIPATPSVIPAYPNNPIIVYVGPGQTLSVDNPGSGAIVTVHATGVVFTS